MKCDYRLQNSANWPIHPNLNNINENVIDESNDDHVDRHKQPDHEEDRRASCKTMHSNLYPVGHSNDLPGPTIAKHHYKY